MFGQAALLTDGDLKLMGAVTLIALGTVAIFYKELLLTSFDNSYAEAAGFPVRAIHYSLMLLQNLNRQLLIEFKHLFRSLQLQ